MEEEHSKEELSEGLEGLLHAYRTAFGADTPYTVGETLGTTPIIQDGPNHYAYRHFTIPRVQLEEMNPHILHQLAHASPTEITARFLDIGCTYSLRKITQAYGILQMQQAPRRVLERIEAQRIQNPDAFPHHTQDMLDYPRFELRVQTPLPNYYERETFLRQHPDQCYEVHRPEHTKLTRVLAAFEALCMYLKGYDAQLLTPQQYRARGQTYQSHYELPQEPSHTPTPQSPHSSQ